MTHARLVADWHWQTDGGLGRALALGSTRTEARGGTERVRFGSAGGSSPLSRTPRSVKQRCWRLTRRGQGVPGGRIGNLGQLAQRSATRPASPATNCRKMALLFHPTTPSLFNAWFRLQLRFSISPLLPCSLSPSDNLLVMPSLSWEEASTTSTPRSRSISGLCTGTARTASSGCTKPGRMRSGQLRCGHGRRASCWPEDKGGRSLAGCVAHVQGIAQLPCQTAEDGDGAVEPAQRGAAAWWSQRARCGSGRGTWFAFCVALRWQRRRSAPPASPAPRLVGP